ncbi:hypothetical protein [Acetobacter peroxydans]|uniref:Uncharacterized protein n=1 Tax=Acetobacter peroxydans TaxID=104098 RepID=A0A4Y3TV05_9PROT|nr:hypothetical protein [Acetobacter peroxydans]NHO17129.1 hypothetical protein [Acetobacter peroxydans]GEB86256.1 hypothetical protein APE01nite_20530 [Acetobacter peroxydans]
MTSMPEAIPTPQTDPQQPNRSAFMRSALSPLLDSLTKMFVYLCFGIIELFLKAFFIFLFVNVCALSILFMGDYIFCNSAHAERFDTIARIIAAHMTMGNVLSFVVLYGVASLFRQNRAVLESVAAINIGKTRLHTPD